MEKPTEYSPVIPPTQSTKPKIFISTKIHKSNHWLKEEDDLLLLLAQKYNEKSWIKVSLFFKNKNPAQCRARYKRIRPGIIKGSWSKEEDNSILQLVNNSSIAGYVRRVKIFLLFDDIDIYCSLLRILANIYAHIEELYYMAHCK